MVNTKGRLVVMMTMMILLQIAIDILMLLHISLKLFDYQLLNYRNYSPLYSPQYTAKCFYPRLYGVVLILYPFFRAEETKALRG